MLEDDRESIATSDNDRDEVMEDIDGAEQENGAEGDNGEGEEEPDQEPEQELEDNQRDATSSHGNPPATAEDNSDKRSNPPEADTSKLDDTTRTSTTPPRQRTPTPAPPLRWRPVIRPEALTARQYDIVPTMAAPMSTSINALAVTPDMRFWLTGGSDGYIRKYDGAATINGKLMLTVAQRHPFVDSVVKAGMLMSYVPNEEPVATNARGAAAEEPALSPVYSLAVHSQALWLLSGLESGGINLYSVRIDEGKRIACLQSHRNAVSVLQLAPDEKSVLSGSWDKNIFNWDLNTGQVARQFDGSGGQISALEPRPASGAPFAPEASDEYILFRGNSSNTMDGNGAKPLPNGILVNGVHGGANHGDGDAVGGDGPGSPAHESLFGSPAGSLFGDTDNNMGGSGAFDGDADADADADDVFQRAIDMALRDEPPVENGAADHTDGGQAEGASTQGGAEAQPIDPDAAPPPAVQPTTDLAAPPNALPNEIMATVNGGHGHETATFGLDTGMAISSSGTAPTQQSQDSNRGSRSPDLSRSPQSPRIQRQQSQQQQNVTTTNPQSLPPGNSSSSVALIYSFNEPPPSPNNDPTQTSSTTFFSASIDGAIRIWDRRAPHAVARIGVRPGVPPWCMGACWSPDGNWIYAGRRSGTVEEYSIHHARGGAGAAGGWAPERTLKFPPGSGPVSAVRPMVNGRHLVCASHDILRLYDLHDNPSSRHSTVPFLVIPGPPRAGVISALYVDPSSRFMISTAGTRGWDGSCTEVLIGYEIGVAK